MGVDDAVQNCTIAHYALHVVQSHVINFCCISILSTPCIVGASPQRRANGKKGGRNSAGAMNLLANAAEDNEAYENPLTHAQLQQLQQHLLQQQFQVNSMHVLIICCNNRVCLSLSKQYIIKMVALPCQDFCKYIWQSQQSSRGFC